MAGCLLRTYGEAPEPEEVRHPQNVVSAPLSLQDAEDEVLQEKSADLQVLGRSSHLRILTITSNVVRILREGPNGKLVKWTTPSGEQCEAEFQHEEPELDPQVLNGERVEWINPTNQPCTIEFDKDECPEPPFEDGKRQFTIAPGQSVFSSVIKGKLRGRYGYLVNFDAPPDSDGGGNRGNPVIIIRG